MRDVETSWLECFASSGALERGKENETVSLICEPHYSALYGRPCMKFSWCMKSIIFRVAYQSVCNLLYIVTLWQLRSYENGVKTELERGELGELSGDCLQHTICMLPNKQESCVAMK